MLHRLTLLLLITIPLQVKAQDLNETLSRVGENYARLYLEPLINGLGADLNTGLFNTAHIGDLPYGLDFYLGVQASGMLLSDTDKSFDLSYQSTVNLDYRIGSRTVSVPVPATLTIRNAPTIFGATEAPQATVTAQHDTTLYYLGVAIPVSIDSTFTTEMIGGLVNMDIAPFATIHASVGSIFGTSITFRWLPRIEVEDLGALEMYGIGISHSLSQYFREPPLDVAVQVMWHDFAVDGSEQEQIVDASSFALSFMGSRRMGFLTLYGGAQIEESTINVSYTLDPELTITDEQVDGPIPIEFGADGVNNARGILGAAVQLGPVRTSADFGFGQVNTISVGFGVAL